MFKITPRSNDHYLVSQSNNSDSKFNIGKLKAASVLMASIALLAFGGGGSSNPIRLLQKVVKLLFITKRIPYALITLLFFTVEVSANTPPTINSTAITSATQDAPYSYAMTGSDVDIGDTLTWSGASGAPIPDWLSIVTGSTTTQEIATITGPGGIAQDVAGNIYVAELSGDQIYMITPAGVKSSYATVQASSKYGLLVHGQYLYISYYNLNKITRIDMTNSGAGESDWISPITDPLAMIVRDDYMYVAQYSADKVSKIEVADPTNITDFITGTPYPFGIGITKDFDKMYIASYNFKYLSSATITAGALDTLTPNVKTFTSSLTDVKLDSQGNIYVSSFGGGVKKLSADLSTETDIGVTTSRVWGMNLDTSGALSWGLNGQNRVVKLETGAVLTGTPTNAEVGQHSVSVSVTDSINSAVTQSFIITVANINDAPTIIGTPGTVVAEDDAYSFAPVGADIDVGDSLTFSITNKPSWAEFSTSTGELSGTPDSNADVGITNNIVITVTDTSAASVSLAHFNLTVTGVNDAPVISGTPAETILEGASYSFTPTASDEENDSYTFSIVNKPSWASFNTSTGQLTGTPVNGDVGTTTGILISVSDESESASLSAFDLRVLADLDGDQDPDTDGDGMSDAFEIAYGLDPRDASDASGDLDGDGVSNLDEFNATSDPARDDFAPTITVSGNITVDAVALFTPVPISATAVDGLDGDLIPSVTSIVSNGTDPIAQATNPTHFRPGIHVLTWSVADAAGNTETATQTINVNPLVDFSKDQVTSEGSTVTFSAILNGKAVTYPVSIPYLVSGTAANDGGDHDLVDGAVIISAGTEAVVSFTTIDDGTGEGLENIVVTMGTPVNAVNGPNTTHTIDVFEGNVGPTVSLKANQASGSATLTVVQTAGNAVISSHVIDPNPSDGHSFDWSRTDNSLINIDSTDTSFTFDPSGLIPGLYTLRVTVSDGNEHDDAEITLNVVASAPVLTTTDSDGDGTDDLTEGYGDSDGDGIADYLDAIDASHVLQEQIGQSTSHLIESEPGLTLALSNIAFAKGGGQAEVSMQDIIDTDGRADQASRYAYQSGLFDFAVSGLPVAGQSVNIVLAQLAAIPTLAVYRKLTTAGWQDFVVDSNNIISSAAGEEGFCPPPGDAVYQRGLAEGHWCVQLTIEDGGPNDSDDAVNNSVVDPGGVAQVLAEDVDITVGNSGSGSVAPLWLALLGLIALLRLKSVTRKGGGK